MENAARKREAFHRAAAHLWEKSGLMPAFCPMNPKTDAEFAKIITEGLQIPHRLLPDCEDPQNRPVSDPGNMKIRAEENGRMAAQLLHSQ